MPKKLFIAIVVCCLMSSPAWAEQPLATASGVRSDAEAAVQTRVGTQKKFDKWAAEEAELMDKAEALERELEVTTKQRKKAEIYLDSQKQKVADLEHKLKEIERIRAELEPFMDETMTRLADFVAQDMPFLAEERQDRLKDLADKLGDYDASPAQKARRLMEALRIEAQYGTTVDVHEQEVNLDGGPRQVRVLRLGRLGLFAIGLDDRSAWRFDKATGKWVAMDDYERLLAQAADMAQRIRVVSLIELPVGKAPAGEVKP